MVSSPTNKSLYRLSFTYFWRGLPKMENGLAHCQAEAGSFRFPKPRGRRLLELKAASHGRPYCGGPNDQSSKRQKEQIAANVFWFAAHVDEGQRDGKQHHATIDVMQMIGWAEVEDEEQCPADEGLQQCHRRGDPEGAAIDRTNGFGLTAEEQ